MKRLILLCSVILALTLGYAAVAYAHCCSTGTGMGAVASGEWLVWRDASKYNIRTPVTAWDNYSCYGSYNGDECPGVSVDQNPTDLTNLPVTLVYVDFSQRVNYDGQYRPAASPDQIALNRYWLDSESATYVSSVIKHETGHALSFSHTPCTSYYKYNSVMYGCGVLINRIGTHDVQDYVYKWTKHVY